MKTVKCNKRDLLDLHNLLARIPKEKSEKPEDTLRLMNVYRAIKKQLKDYLDTRAGIQKRINDKMRTLSTEVEKAREIGEQVKTESDQQKKDFLLAQQTQIINEANKKLEPLNKEDADLLEGLKPTKCEVVFDNEDFLYLETTFEDCARAIFGFQTPSQVKDGKPEERIDLETMDKIFTILESVTA